MSRKENIKKLQQALEAEEQRIKALFKSGRIPGKEDYKELDRLKKELKTERSLLTKESRRVSPAMSKTVGLVVTKEEYQALNKRAKATGKTLSKYLRELIFGG